MLTLQTNIWEITLVSCCSIISYFFAKQAVKIIIKIIFTSKPVMQWNIKRQLEQRKLHKKTELELLNENINNLEQFLNWINKHIPHNQHKQFYRNFANSKETRDYWIKTLREMINPKKEEPKIDEQNKK